MYTEEINIHNIYKSIINYRRSEDIKFCILIYLIFVSLMGNLKTNGMHVIRKNI